MPPQASLQMGGTISKKSGRMTFSRPPDTGITQELRYNKYCLGKSDTYHQLDRKEKRKLENWIRDQVYNESGRFLKFDKETKPHCLYVIT
mmetsp:Transcript_31731/g.76814  ORF Transcript_31731/g.76814 Transcript_31731/m.76814 type:complete len:90 (+) Transcript_31731:280-549(+)